MGEREALRMTPAFLNDTSELIYITNRLTDTENYGYQRMRWGGGTN